MRRALCTHAHTLPPPLRFEADGARWALAFAALDETPRHAIVGWHPGPVPVAGGAVALDVARFEENAVFVRLLHAVVRRHLPASPVWQKRARELGSGWMNVLDQRSGLARATPSEDIVGTIQLADGRMLADTYEPMPTHRLYTDAGVFRLDTHLQRELEQAILVAHPEL